MMVVSSEVIIGWLPGWFNVHFVTVLMALVCHILFDEVERWPTDTHTHTNANIRTHTVEHVLMTPFQDVKSL